ncbi:transposase, IS801/IS1294 family protein [Desulfosarcina variabilis str. Montpellier]
MHHSGFNVYCRPTIWPNDENALENLARYIIRVCSSQERMTCIPSNAGSSGDDPPAIKDAHISCEEYELTYDFSCSQLPPVDYRVEYGSVGQTRSTVQLRLKMANFGIPESSE